MALAASDPVGQPAGAWTITFDDEFNGTSLDTTKWSPQDIDCSVRNNELEAYEPANTSVSNGLLHLTATKSSVNYGYCGASSIKKNYASGIAITMNKFDQQFGYFEASVKLPKGNGFWPAFWMMPYNVWPPEIDIMESLGQDPTTIYMTNWWGTSSANAQSKTYPYTGADFSAGFHVFAVKWTASDITWYVDGIQRAHSTSGIPSQPFFMMLNLAVGGDWPVPPDSSTVFPSEMQVDYVRAWKAGSSCTNLCSPANAKQCSGASAYQTCSDTNGDGCTEWGTAVACSSGYTCSAGACVKSCTSACTSGAKQCSGNGVQTCSDTNGDGCTEWGIAVACQTGYTCSTGTCVAPSCTNACTSGAKQCGGNGVQTCSDTNGDGCTEWGTAVACQTGYTCLAGSCAASGNGPALSFVSPTDVSGATITRSYTEPTVSVQTNSNLSNFNFSWVGTNYNLYDSSLVFASNFNNNSSAGDTASTVGDISTLGNNGTCYTGTTKSCSWTTSGMYGGALQFNGTSNYIACGSAASVNLVSALTIEAWVNPQAVGQGDLVHKLNWDTNKGYALNLDENNSVEFILGNGTKRVSLASSQVLPANSWSHVAVVLSSGKMKLYINGINTGQTASFSGSIKNSSDPLTLGRNSNWSGEYFKGIMDETRIYNRVLTDAEIKMHYQSELKKNSTTSWTFYDKIAGLIPSSSYTYSATAKNSGGYSGSSEVRALTTAAQLSQAQSSQTQVVAAQGTQAVANTAIASTADSASTAAASSQTKNSSSIQEQIRSIQQRIQELTASLQAGIALGLIK